MTKLIEHELNLTPKTNQILNSIKTSEQYIICRSLDADSVNYRLSVDSLIIFPPTAFINSRSTPYKVVFSIFGALKSDNFTYWYLSSFISWFASVPWSILHFDLSFPYLWLLLFSIRSNNLSHLIFHLHVSLVRKRSIKIF